MKKVATDNRSTITKGFIKPQIPNFPGTKAPTGFKPTARMGTINRGRR
jgi:hypothetical protein